MSYQETLVFKCNEQSELRHMLTIMGQIATFSQDFVGKAETLQTAPLDIAYKILEWSDDKSLASDDLKNRIQDARQARHDAIVELRKRANTEKNVELDPEFEKLVENENRLCLELLSNQDLYPCVVTLLADSGQKPEERIRMAVQSGSVADADVVEHLGDITDSLIDVWIMAWRVNPVLFLEMMVINLESLEISGVELTLACKKILENTIIPEGVSDWMFGTFYYAALSGALRRSREYMHAALARALKSMINGELGEEGENAASNLLSMIADKETDMDADEEEEG